MLTSIWEILAAADCDQMEPGDWVIGGGSSEQPGAVLGQQSSFSFASHMSRADAVGRGVLMVAQGKGESSTEPGHPFLEQESQPAALVWDWEVALS